MKKLLIFLLGLVILLGALTISLPLNIKMREIIKSRFEAHDIVETVNTVVLGSSEGVFIDDLSENAIELSNASGHKFIKLAWLKQVGATYSYDESLDELNIVKDDSFVIINSNGSTKKNGIELSDAVSIRQISGEWYIALDALDRVIPNLFYYEYFEARHVLLVTTVPFANQYVVSNDDTYLYLDLEAMKDEQASSELSHWQTIFNGAMVSENLDGNTPLFILPIDDTAYFALTPSGNTGYVLKDKLDISEPPVDKSFLEDKTRLDSNVHLVWEAVYSRNPNTNQIQNLEGINVVSPTWYALEDGLGTLSSLAGNQYTSWAKENGYEIWPLVSNSFDPDLTHELLNSASSRQNFIDFIVEEAIAKNYDGINIDFENVYLADKDALSHFINELSWYLKPLGITLSMDVTVIAESDNWSKCFDRAVLGDIVDYLIVMTYDEYWDSSPISGPVASYNWVERSLNEILKSVPNEKIVMGVPLYTRIWSETISSSDENTYENSAVSVGIASQNTIVEEKDLETIWLDAERLYYTAYVEDGVTKKIWIENLETIQQKLLLSDELSLAGQAFWRRGLEPTTFWEELYQ